MTCNFFRSLYAAVGLTGRWRYCVLSVSVQFFVRHQKWWIQYFEN